MMDTVLSFEGDDHYTYRLLRSIKIDLDLPMRWCFEMKQDGLDQVPNPSAYFLAERNQEVSGSAIGCIMEGSRLILWKFKHCAHVYGTPQRTVTGMDRNRVLLFLAVLEKRRVLNFWIRMCMLMWLVA